MGHPRVLLLIEPSLGLAPVIIAVCFAPSTAQPGGHDDLPVIEQNARHSAGDRAPRGPLLEQGRIVKRGPRPMCSRAHDPEVEEHYFGQAAH